MFAPKFAKAQASRPNRRKRLGARRERSLMIRQSTGSNFWKIRRRHAWGFKPSHGISAPSHCFRLTGKTWPQRPLCAKPLAESGNRPHPQCEPTLHRGSDRFLTARPISCLSVISPQLSYLQPTACILHRQHRRQASLLAGAPWMPPPDRCSKLTSATTSAMSAC